MSRRPAALAIGCAVAASVLTVVPLSGSQGADFRGIRLASPGTSQAVTFDAVVGDRVFFSTATALVSTDQDDKLDVYRWSDGTLTLMTLGTGADVQFDAAVRGGDMLIGSTREGHLTNVLYLWRFTAAGGHEFNTTTGVDAYFKAASPDGNAVAFESAEDAIDWDDDGEAVDVLVAYLDPNDASSVTQLPLSPGTAFNVSFAGGSTDLHSIIYSTEEALASADENAMTDFYAEGDAWGDPGYTLVSDGVGGPDTLNAVAANGSAIVYTTSDDNAAAGDTDGQTDVYWSMGLGGDLHSGGTAPATFAGATPGLEAVYYSTTAQLDPTDTDQAADVYVRDLSGLPALLTGGIQDLDAHLHDVSATGGIVFDTTESLALGDPGGRDLYTLDDATNPVLLSGGGLGDVTFGGVTDDDDVYFTSSDRLTSADTDDAQDVYVNEGGTITLVSGGTANTPAFFEGANADGTLAVFSTTEQLTSGDNDALADLYTFGPVTPAPPPDTTPPDGTATAKTQKNDGTIEVTLTCGSAESCTATTSGTLTVPTVAARGKKTYTLKGATVVVGAGGKATLKLKVPKKAKKAAAGALKAGKKVKAKITVVVADASGNKRTVKVTVKLKA